MRMELIQPFINAADSVFSESLQSPAKIIDLTMDEETYRRKGVAALIAIKGDIEGRVILDLAPEVAMRVASQAGTRPPWSGKSALPVRPIRMFSIAPRHARASTARRG